MADRPTDLHSLGLGVSNHAPQTLQAGADGPEPSDNHAERGSAATLGWRLFGSMRRGWVIVILAVLAWVALVLIGLALWGLLHGH
jgi:hypothetical protein